MTNGEVIDDQNSRATCFRSHALLTLQRERSTVSRSADGSCCASVNRSSSARSDFLGFSLDRSACEFVEVKPSVVDVRAMEGNVRGC